MSDRMEKGEKGEGRSPGARRALLGFGLGLGLLLVFVAMAEGIGDPAVPSNAVAVVEGAPGDSGTITKAEFEHSLETAAGEHGMKAVPEAGGAAYGELKEAALNSLLDMVWVPGEAEELGISVTADEVSAEVKKVKAEGFKTDAEYRRFVKASHFTPADVRAQVKLQMLSKRAEEALRHSAPPSQAEIDGYYEGARSSKFTQPARRDVRVIVNEDPAKVEAAKAALEEDHSAASWQRLAKEYSEDPATRLTGGLQRGLAFGSAESALNDAVFVAPTGRVEGPVKSHTIERFYVFEVESATPEKVVPLEQVKTQIVSELRQRAAQESASAFIGSRLVAWKSRTYCAPDYVIERCSNFRGDAHPVNAPPACYEGNPKAGLPEACPAPVSQLVPTLPGKVNVAAPKGKPLAQRPQPAGL